MLVSGAMSRAEGGWTSRRCRVAAGLVLATLLGGPARAVAAAPAAPDVAAPASASPDESDIRRLISEYARAIEGQDIVRFRKVKPNLSKDEESRLRRAFESIETQEVKITILAIEIRQAQAVARLARRDTINGSLVSSFPQTLSLAKGAGGWTIEQIGR